MRRRKVAKRIVACVSVMVMLIFCAIPAMASDLVTVDNPDVTQGVTTKATYTVNMQQISVYPTYLNEAGELVTTTGYRYSRSGNNLQVVGCRVSPANQTVMEQNVANLGQTHVGYLIRVFYTCTKNGIVVTRQPENIPNQRVMIGLQKYTDFYITKDKTYFLWDAYLSFEGQTRLMNASVLFEQQ